MEVVIFPDPTAVCLRAADIVTALLARTPAAVIGLPTGETPRALYKELVRRFEARRLSFASATTFNLDEFVGVPAHHPASYSAYMRAHLFSHVDLDPARAHVPRADIDDVPGACAAYEDAIRRAGGIDLQVLGLGVEGHIGFNEPTSALSSRTRIKTLTRATLELVRPAWLPDEPPRHVVTMGIGTILEARRCVLLATGASKARAVAAMAEGPLTAMVPASALQLHPRATVLVDEAAAAALTRADEYRDVERHKPAWQRVEDHVDGEP